MSSPARLAIETPESVRFRYEVADVGARALALSIDFLVQYLVLGLGFITYHWLVPVLEDVRPVLWGLILFGIHWFYFVAFELAWSGQTPGKRAVGIRVVRAGGYPVTWVAVLARNLLRVIDSLPATYGVALVVSFCDRERRRLGDVVARTVVVRERKAPVTWDASVSAAPAPGTAAATFADAVLTLALDEATRELAADYVARRDALTPDARARVRAEVIETVLDRAPSAESRSELVSRLSVENQDPFLVSVASS